MVDLFMRAYDTNICLIYRPVNKIELVCQPKIEVSGFRKQRDEDATREMSQVNSGPISSREYELKITVAQKNVNRPIQDEAADRKP